MDAAREIAAVAHNVNCADYDHAPRLFLDAGGVSMPVVDTLEHYLPSGVKATHVLWTSRAKVKRVDGELHCGKGWVVSRLQALLDTNRIEIPESSEAQVLLEELASFEVRITDHGTVVASGRGRVTTTSSCPWRSASSRTTRRLPASKRIAGRQQTIGRIYIGRHRRSGEP